MIRFIRIILIAGIVLCMFAGAVHAGWRFPVGLAYVSGYEDIKDLYEDNLHAEGYATESTSGLPIGLIIQPYYQFDFGLGIGVGLGPVMAIFGDRDFVNVPVAVDARFAFLPNNDFSPYVRGGVKKHFASGDYVNESSVGVFGGFGLEFMRKKKVGVGVEFLIDTSSIEFEKKTRSNSLVRTSKEDIEPSKLLINISAIF